jgi:hypothetical protein
VALYGNEEARQNDARDSRASRQKGNFKTTYPSDFSITFSFLIKCYLSTAITIFLVFPTQDGFFIAFTPVHQGESERCV